MATASETLYIYSYTPRRGVEGFSAANVLRAYGGNLVHDFRGAYDKLGDDHSRCNACLLGELKAFAEVGNRWAGEIIAVLLAMKKAADSASENDLMQVNTVHRKRLQSGYDKWMKAGLKAHPEITQPTGRSGICA